MPVIFISRGTMSGVRLLVDCLHDRSGIRCISSEDLEKIVNQHGDLATRIVEKLVTATSAYAQFSELRWPYIVLMRQALLEEIRHDSMIYHGYSGHLLLPRLRHFVRVRIEAPLNMRVEMTMQRLSCDEEKAREYINEQDDRRVKWARFMFAQDIRNMMLYDLNLNMGHMTLEAACEIIKNLIEEPDFQATPESQAEVDRLYLATNIEEALVTDPRTASVEISAEVDKDDGIRLIGPYLDDPELETVIEIAKSVPGVDTVQYVPGYAPKFEVNGHF
jgi:cytidylate kinase